MKSRMKTLVGLAIGALALPLVACESMMPERYSRVRLSLPTTVTVARTETVGQWALVRVGDGLEERLSVMIARKDEETGMFHIVADCQGSYVIEATSPQGAYIATASFRVDRTFGGCEVDWIVPPSWDEPTRVS